MAPRTKPDDSDRQAARLLFETLGAMPVTSYAQRCSGQVMVRLPLAVRHPCANEADENGVLCAGPCVPLWRFDNAK